MLVEGLRPLSPEKGGLWGPIADPQSLMVDLRAQTQSGVQWGEGRAQERQSPAQSQPERAAGRAVGTESFVSVNTHL